MQGYLDSCKKQSYNECDSLFKSYINNLGEKQLPVLKSDK